MLKYMVEIIMAANWKKQSMECLSGFANSIFFWIETFSQIPLAFKLYILFVIQYPYHHLFLLSQSEGGGCFPTSGRVTLGNGKIVTMSDLQIGNIFTKIDLYYQQNRFIICSDPTLYKKN